MYFVVKYPSLPGESMNEDWLKVLGVAIFVVSGIATMFYFAGGSQIQTGEAGGGDTGGLDFGWGGGADKKIPLTCDSFKKECPDFKGVTEKPCTPLQLQAKEADCGEQLQRIFECAIPLCARDMMTQEVMADECGDTVQRLINCLHRADMRSDPKPDTETRDAD
jgi:hypothetical protein